MPIEDSKVIGLSSSKSTKKIGLKIITPIIGILVLILGVVAGIFLVNQQQNISEKAAPSCVEQCPGADKRLYNCHPPESDGTAQISICDRKGRVEFCRSTNYCCPVAGGTWTTDMTACLVATSSPTARSTSSATAVSTATSSSTTRATSTAISTVKSSTSPTSAPVPVTGASIPTIIGTGFGMILIIVSLSLAI